MANWSCPVPLEGETLFSLVARLYLRAGFKSPHGMFRRAGLRNGSSVASPLGGPYLPMLFKALPELSEVLSLEDAVWRHTTSPIYLALSNGGSGSKSRSKFIETVLEAGWKGIPRSSFHIVPSGMRFCIDCCEQDMQQFGIPYWHREHQFKFVSCCWKHGSRLKEVRKQVGKGYGLDLPSVGWSEDPSVELRLPKALRNGIDLEVSSAFVTILNSPRWSSPGEIRNTLLRASGAQGLLCRGRPSRRKIWDMVVGAYGVEFLGSLGLPVEYGSGVVKRYMTPFKEGAPRLDPAMTILVACALGVDAKELCGDGADNSLASCCGDDSSVSEDDAQPDEELIRVLESCGYVLGRAADVLGVNRHRLVQRILRAGMKCPIVSGNASKFSEAEILQMIELVRSGVPREQVIDKFSCTDSMLDQLPIYDPRLREDAKKARHERVKTENREIVTSYIERGGDVTRTALWQKLPGPMSFLLKCDKSWLGEVLDGLPKQTTGAPGAKTGRARTDDDEFDESVLKKLEAIKSDVGAFVPPRRITAALSFRVADVPPSVFIKLKAGRMPRTKAFLDQIVESDHEYVRRKLRYGLAQLSTTRETLTAISLRLASGLPEHQLKRYRGLVHELALEMGIPFSSRTARWLS